jgi:hypothetical protein
MIPIDSIEIPERFVTIASEWYGGQGDLLYAVCSTGGLTIGTICPVRDYTDIEDRDRKHYYTIWKDLSIDVGYARRICQDGLDADDDNDDIDYESDLAVLTDFEDWIDDVILPHLAESYGLEDWDGCDN